MSDLKPIKKFFESTCSPKTVKGNRIPKNYDGCLSKDILVSIANAYNKEHPDQMIRFNKKTSKDALYGMLTEKFQDTCTDDNHAVCWINHTRHKSDDIVKRVYRKTSIQRPPDWDYNPNTWLSNFDIEKYLKQYEQGDFIFLGVHPIDFNEKVFMDKCFSQKMCDFSIKHLRTRLKKKRLGVVFNLDRHNQPGSHWVALFCNTDPTQANYGVFYYDSNANAIPETVRKFSEKCVHEINDPKFKLHVNHVRHQKSFTECGMFSCTFISCMVLAKKTNFEKLMKQDTIFNDEYMTMLRRKLFVNYKVKPIRS